MTSIAGLDKAEVLAALYDNSKPLGFGMAHFTPEPMTRTQALDALAAHTRFDGDKDDPEKVRIYFDYLQGRVMKINLGKNDVDTGLYNRDNGPGAAEKVIVKLRAKNGVWTADYVAPAPVEATAAEAQAQ